MLQCSPRRTQPRRSLSSFSSSRSETDQRSVFKKRHPSLGGVFLLLIRQTTLWLQIIEPGTHYSPSKRLSGLGDCQKRDRSSSLRRNNVPEWVFRHQAFRYSFLPVKAKRMARLNKTLRSGRKLPKAKGIPRLSFRFSGMTKAAPRFSSGAACADFRTIDAKDSSLLAGLAGPPIADGLKRTGRCAFCLCLSDRSRITAGAVD